MLLMLLMSSLRVVGGGRCAVPLLLAVRLLSVPALLAVVVLAVLALLVVLIVWAGHDG